MATASGATLSGITLEQSSLVGVSESSGTPSKAPLFGPTATEPVAFVVSEQASHVEGLVQRLQAIGEVIVYQGQDLAEAGVFVGTSARDFGQLAYGEAFLKLFVNVHELSLSPDPSALIGYFNRRFNDPDEFRRWQQLMKVAAQSA